MPIMPSLRPTKSINILNFDNTHSNIKDSDSDRELATKNCIPNYLSIIIQLLQALHVA